MSTGFVFLQGFAQELSSLEAADELGFPDIVEGLNSIQVLVPREPFQSSPNTYSGNFGHSDFPLHTDLAHWACPPRYLVLRCISGLPDVVTRLFDGHELIRRLDADILRMTLVQPRRPMRNGKQLLRLLDRCDPSKDDFIRWDSLYLHPASQASGRVFEKTKEFLSQTHSTKITLAARGDTLVIDNWRYLHGRSPVIGAVRGRRIERVYLKDLR